MRSFAFRSLLPHNIWSKPNTSVIIIETLFICIKGVWIYQESRLSKYWQPLVNFQTFLYVMLLCGLQCFFCKFCSAGSLFFFLYHFFANYLFSTATTKTSFILGGFCNSALPVLLLLLMNNMNWNRNENKKQQQQKTQKITIFTK